MVKAMFVIHARPIHAKMVVQLSKKIIVLHVIGHHGHHSLIVPMLAMVHKVDIEHSMDQIVKINEPKKINNHVHPIVLLFVTRHWRMVQ